MDIIEKNEILLKEKIDKLEEEKRRAAELEESIGMLKNNVHVSSTECELLSVSQISFYLISNSVKYVIT